MPTLQALYANTPFWVWFGLAGLLIGLALASGRAIPLAPALGSVSVGLLELTGLRPPLAFELAFIALVTGLGAAARLALAKAASRLAEPSPAAEPSAELVGRIGRTTGEFVNGVGRVWLDGSEWSAELDFGEDTAPPDARVRVMRVIGGVKLQVRALADIDPLSLHDADALKPG